MNRARNKCFFFCEKMGMELYFDLEARRVKDGFLFPFVIS